MANIPNRIKLGSETSYRVQQVFDERICLKKKIRAKEWSVIANAIRGGYFIYLFKIKSYFPYRTSIKFSN